MPDIVLTSVVCKYTYILKSLTGIPLVLYSCNILVSGFNWQKKKAPFYYYQTEPGYIDRIT